jgi:hypothetical protein
LRVGSTFCSWSGLWSSARQRSKGVPSRLAGFGPSGAEIGCRILMRVKVGNGGANRFRVLARQRHP